MRIRATLCAAAIALSLLVTPAAAQSGYEAVAYQACAQHGCDGAWLVSIMYCESGGNHGAVGPNGERGVMQYHPYGLWPEMAWASAEAQIYHAAWAISNGYSSHWVCAGW